MIDHLKGYPFQLCCLHPDDTYDYAPEVAPGKRQDTAKGRLTMRRVTPAEAHTWLEARPPLRTTVGDAAIEQTIYRVLSSLLYARWDPFPFTRNVALIDFAQQFLAEGFQLADALAALSEASPLAHYYATSEDLNFTALQEEVLRLLHEHRWVPIDTGLDTMLRYDHVLIPADIWAALAPEDDETNESDD